MTEIPRPVVMPFTPRHIDIIDGRDRFESLPPTDRQSILEILRDPSNLGAVNPGIVAADGRNVYMRLNQTGPHSHIQLSGGFYTPLRLGELHLGAQITPDVVNEPISQAFTSIRPVSTLFVRDGVIRKADDSYEPTGGYSLKGARLKYFNTGTASRVLHGSELITTKAIFTYSTWKNNLDPVYGVGLLTIDPNDRYNPRLLKLLARSHDANEHYAFTTEMVTDFASKLRILHDKNFTHGQPHKGNFGMDSATNKTFLTDWTTLVAHRGGAGDLDFHMSRFLDLDKLTDPFITFLEQNTNLGEHPVQAYIYGLTTIASAYLGQDVPLDQVALTLRAHMDKDNRTTMSKNYLQTGARLITSRAGTVVDMGKQQHGKGRRK